MNGVKSSSKTAILIPILFVMGLIPALLLSQFSATNHRKEHSGYLRIVCTSPALCEIVYALDLGEKVAGLGHECNYPPQTRNVKKIGKWGNISLESLAVINPDLLITQGADPSLQSFCKQNGTRLLDFNINNLEEITTAISSIGMITGKQKEAQEITSNIEQILGDIKKKSNSANPPKVLITICRQPGSLSGILSAGHNTFISQLVEICGGKNAFSDALGQWPQVSAETLLVRSPEVILEILPEKFNAQKVAQMKNDWQQLPQLNAVKNRRIYYLCSEQALLPGPRITETAQQLSTLFNEAIQNHE